MPYEIKGLAGAAYTPSNGDEGRRFMAQFCAHCVCDDQVYCPIVFRALAGTDNPEWTHDARGRPKCTAYKPLTFDEERAREARALPSHKDALEK